MEGTAERQNLTVRLVVWGGLVAVWSTLNFVTVATAEPRREEELPVFFQPSFGISGIVVYAVLLGIVLAIAAGLPLRETFALRRPHSIPRALGLSLGVIGIVYVIGVVVGPILEPGEKQNILPREGWVPGHVGAFVLSVIAVAVAAPVVEELMFRGLGFRLLARFGRIVAIVGVGIAFGLAHGIPEALPILVPLGAGFAWLRDRTGSIYPSIVLHSLFNGLQVVVSVL